MNNPTIPVLVEQYAYIVPESQILHSNMDLSIGEDDDSLIASVEHYYPPGILGAIYLC